MPFCLNNNVPFRYIAQGIDFPDIVKEDIFVPVAEQVGIHVPIQHMLHLF